METYLLDRDEVALEAIIAQEIEQLGVQEPFLDVGAGTGIWVHMVKRSGFRAFGLDPSYRLMQAARDRYGLDTLVIGDGCSLPFPRDYFGWLQLGEVIEHVGRSDGETLLREAHRVLQPGGGLRLTTPNRLKYLVPARGVVRRAAGLFGRSDDPAHLHEFWPWELRALLVRSGFRIRMFRFRNANRYVPVNWVSAGIEVVAVKA